MPFDVEGELECYRPVGPPKDLRDRVIAAAAPRVRWREWIPAAAAVLLAVVFYALAADARNDAASHVAAPDSLDDYTWRVILGESDRRDDLEWRLWLQKRTSGEMEYAP